MGRSNFLPAHSDTNNEVLSVKRARGLNYVHVGGALLSLLLQGICQGNDIAPAGWTLIAVVLLHCYKREGFGAKITTPIMGWII